MATWVPALNWIKSQIESTGLFATGAVMVGFKQPSTLDLPYCYICPKGSVEQDDTNATVMRKLTFDIMHIHSIDADETELLNAADTLLPLLRRRPDGGIPGIADGGDVTVGPSKTGTMSVNRNGQPHAWAQANQFSVTIYAYEGWV